MKLSEFVKAEYGKSISECTNEELYYALLTLTKKMASGKQHGNSKKKLYYISAEFLIGKLLSNNLINLGIYDEVKEELAQNGKDICEIEEFENEPSLGNGGLGRLAACFIDSIATLGLNGDGVGLNYHLSVFSIRTRTCRIVSPTIKSIISRSNPRSFQRTAHPIDCFTSFTVFCGK